jgi:hypothetical protein
MKKLSLLSAIGLLLAGSIYLLSCNNQQPAGNTAFSPVEINKCLLNCAAKEIACWDEYDKCKGRAKAEEQAALNTCSHLPKQNQSECKSDALSDYLEKLEQCEKNLRACLGQLKNCRADCSGQWTKLPDTK